MSIILRTQEIKSFFDLSKIANIIANIKKSKYREKKGALHTFISNTGTGLANYIHFAATWTSGALFVANPTQNKTVIKNATYNYFSCFEKSNIKLQFMQVETVIIIQLEVYSFLFY